MIMIDERRTKKNDSSYLQPVLSVKLLVASSKHLGDVVSMVVGVLTLITTRE